MQIPSKHKIFNIVGLASTGVLAGLTLVALCPAQIDGVNAETATSTSTTNYSAVVHPVLSIALDENIKVEFNPTAAGEFKNSNANLTISTNNISGYRILMNAIGGSNSLDNASGDGSIPSITTAVTATDFPSDSWGYNLTKSGETLSTYQNIPTVSTEVRNVETGDVTAGLTDNYTLNFGTKVTPHTPAGVYNKEILVSVVANAAELRTITDITTMQDMNSKICLNTPTETSTQLQDARDNKWYWVTKLRDGNCWMTQNLDLDITEAGLSAKDTNIDVDWNDKSTYPPKQTKDGLNFNGVSDSVSVGATETNSWNMGNYKISNPGQNRACLVNKGEAISKCGEGTAQLLSYTLDDGAAIGKEELHYHIGNYYQWNSAVAGSGSTLTDTSAPISICPKGWRLPTISTDDNTFAELLSRYNITSGNADVPTRLTSAPLYFTQTGFVYPIARNQFLNLIGSYGYLWSNTAGTSLNSALTFGYSYGVDISLAYSDARFNGYPVRCVAR